jgi:hypothetical protein
MAAIWTGGPAFGAVAALCLHRLNRHIRILGIAVLLAVAAWAIAIGPARA